jgi:EAL domain-containing protein (putative c-di-GMP-specific phosphodiesterase class I)
VLGATDGFQALAELDLTPGIDLVFCDVELPGMDGMELIGNMVARGFRPDLVLLSAVDSGILESVRYMAQSYGFPAVGVIAKPLDREALFRLFGDAPKASTLPGTPGPEPAPPSRREIEHGLKHREFECYFQPQLAMGSTRLKGAEALVRWHHPERGLLAPAAFLPWVEQDPELMARLTVQILEQIAGQQHSWRASGLHVVVSVNLSPSSLALAGFAERILGVLAGHGVSPRDLVLEITESMSVSNLGQTLANLARLRMRGLQLSLDDFCTGYATYQQLERIPFNELKVDISITRHLQHSRKQAILARSIIQLGKDLGLKVVAEGIETQGCWDLLKAMGCDYGQGYFLARPMPGGRLVDWSLRGRAHL